MSKRILIVEDDAAQRAVLLRVLRREGMDVTGVPDLATARSMVRSDDPDLVLLDLQLPDGSGLDLLSELRRESNRGDFIVMTGMNDLSIAVEAMQLGAYDFIAKPFDRATILELVHRCFEDQLAREKAGPRAGGDSIRPRGNLVGASPRMLEVFKLMGMAATSRSPVLIRGASGTGKELVARMIHEHQMPDRPFLALNCAALPDGLLETELFGHERGAFTGAQTSRRGALELAGDGTLLLDEIGDTSPAFPTQLLRVLQEREFAPLGSERTRPLKARVMAATHRPLEELTETEEFRSDLYFRLRVIEITLPTLTERREDIPRIALHLLRAAAERLEKPVHHIPPEVMSALMRHTWPGNVRELENAITRAVALAKGPSITLETLDLTDVEDATRGPGGVAVSAELHQPEDGFGPGRGSGPEGAGPADESLDAVIQVHVREVLDRAEGNKREAARRLGISPARLYRILSEID
jgi:DNA-binding NtrC family response regulator